MLREPRLVSAALLGCLLALVFAVPVMGLSAAETAAPSQSQETSVASAAQSQEWEPWSNTSMEAKLQPDGDAVWTISTTMPIEDEADVEQFQTLAADFENGELTAPGLAVAETAVENVNRRTNRLMQIRDVDRQSTPPSELEPGSHGKLAVQFTWESFGRVEADRIYVDDVLLLTNGELWMPSLGEGQTFIMIGPEGYGVQANPGEDGTFEGDRIRWEGQTTFEKSNLEAEFIGGGPSGGNDTDDNPVDGGEETDEGLSLWLVLIPLLLLGVAAVVAAARFADLGIELPAGEEEGTPDQALATDTDAAAAEGATAAETEPADKIDAELLSDEERVERLLEQNGGRMKQATIVKETDWSDAKVSQLLSTMENDGRIDKLRIGRENLISFPDEDITEIDE